MHFFHSSIFNKIASKSLYFSPIYFPFSFFDNIEHFNVLGLESGKTYSRRTVFYDLPFDFTSGIHHRNLKRLLVTINSNFSNSVYIEVRNLGNLKPYDQNILMSKYSYEDWYNILIDTSNYEKTWNDIADTKKRQIKSSLKKGVEIIEAENEGQVIDFFKIIRKLYDYKIHKPLPDLDFFKAFYNETKDTEYGRIILVKYKDKIISGIVCPITPGEEIYEWYIAGLDKEFKGTGVYPSVLATWAGIEYALKNNIPQFNFMGAGQPGKPYGVRDFKLQFGGELINAGRYVKVNKPLIYKLGKLYFKLRA